MTDYIYLIPNSKKNKNTHTHTHKKTKKAKETKEEKITSVENLMGYDDIVSKICSVYF